ncbi:YczE/YyaS/YitT family protein [Propionispira raffinosivorans]|uniref:YczE/YyaS/YitT family protein n=1 Tax=Propionispira raffinosivorans TaxID=86959 RepID=UPI0003715AAF|nr:membrane protein [Propionispira raffinosivorans]
MIDKLLKVIIVVVGTMVAAFGVTIFLNGNIGVDPISTLILGVQCHVDMSFGTINQIFSSILLVIMLFFDKKNIGVGSVFYALGCGYFINIFTIMGIGQNIEITSIGVTLLGVVIFGMGLGIYLSGNLGAGPVEVIMLYWANKFSFSIKVIRISLDATFVVIGLLLGAKLGIGTLIGVLLTGPCIEVTLITIKVCFKKGQLN